MGKSIRIKTTPGGGDKYVSLNVEQDFDFLEVLSVKIRQEDVYRRFCADYGVVVGRVILNDGFGAPNAKVSVFIPLDEEDEDNTLITSIYPFKSVTDQNDEFIRYNLLPDDKQNQNHQPVGTFPSKRKILNNDVYLDVYDKYYKFTTTTNGAGDFMLFGVPVGQQTIHFDLDLSDMGDVSLSPADLITSGVDEGEFIAVKPLNKSTTYEFKGSTNLDTLPQIKSTNIDVSVQPFWGDTEQCQVGITRLDWQVEGTIIPSAIFFGSIMGESIHYYQREKAGCTRKVGTPSISENVKNLNGDIEIYTITKENTTPSLFRLGRFEEGRYAITIPMNGGYLVTDEVGNQVVSTDVRVGIPSYGDYRVRFVPDEIDYTINGYNLKRGYHMLPSNHHNNVAVGVDAPLTLRSGIVDAYADNITNEYMGFFYDRPYVYYNRLKAGHIYSTVQQQGGGVNGPLNGIFKMQTLSSENPFPLPLNSSGVNFPTFFKLTNNSTGGRLVGNLYFPSFIKSDFANKCSVIPEDLVQGLNANTSNCTPKSNWNDTQAKAIGHMSSLFPFYYIQAFKNLATQPWDQSKEIGLVEFIDLNEGYDFFNETGNSKLPNDLPETSAGLQVQTSIEKDQYKLGSKYWYVYFGTSPNNTSLNIVKEKYNV